MTQVFLNEREFELINIVGSQLASNQRALSRHMNLSLGMTNMLLHRLITKGYIRIKQLNQKKVEYILTPKGFTEKMRKTISYTLKTLHSIGLIKKQISIVLDEYYTKGYRCFFVLGEPDLAELIEVVVKDDYGTACQVTRIKEISQVDNRGILLICTENFQYPQNSEIVSVQLIHELAKATVPMRRVEV
jgi:predicted transcriptional regulator